MYGTKYCVGAMVPVTITKDSVFPVFGKVFEIWVVEDFVYFEVTLFDTSCLDSQFQCWYHLKYFRGQTYIPLKYDLYDIIEAYADDNLLLAM